MSKLTKAQIKQHQQACDLLDKDVLTFDEKLFVYENWQEGADFENSSRGAFFTPIDLANDFSIEMTGPKVIDLCAGTGVLSFLYYHSGYGYRNHGDAGPEITCVEINPTYVEIGKKLLPEARWYCRSHGTSWQVDETYIKVKGKWKYLYRAITKSGDTIDFYLSHTRNGKAAKRFLSKALKVNKNWMPTVINTDKNPAYNQAIIDLNQSQSDCAQITHRKVKYLNNLIESDHGKLKRLIKPMLGFKTMKSANSTIIGYEIMRMFKKGQFDFWLKVKSN